MGTQPKGKLRGNDQIKALYHQLRDIRRQEESPMGTQPKGTAGPKPRPNRGGIPFGVYDAVLPITIAVCAYCRTTDAYDHSGSCINCGAPQRVTSRPHHQSTPRRRDGSRRRAIDPDIIGTDRR